MFWSLCLVHLTCRTSQFVCFFDCFFPTLSMGHIFCFICMSHNFLFGNWTFKIICYNNSSSIFPLRVFFLQFSCSVVSNCLRPHGLQDARLLCPSPTPGSCSNSCRWCHPTISSSVVPVSSCLQSFPASGSFPMSQSSPQVANVLELQHQSFQWIFRTDFHYDWLVGSLCSRRDSQESSPTSQFKSINSSVLNFLYDPTLTSIHDYIFSCWVFNFYFLLN